MTSFEETGTPTYELLVADTEARAETVRSNFDVTAIYGWHLTPEQAYGVIEHIEDNSIVFVEGHMRERAYAVMRLVQHIILAETRLESGRYEADAADRCEALAAEFLKREYSVPTEHDLHSHSLYKGLLDKGCVVLPADYLNLGESTPALTPLEDLQEELRSLFPIESDAVLEQAIEIDSNLHTKRLNNQVVREQAAFNLVLYFLNRYSGAEGLASLANAPNGKTKAYLIFGLAHRDSLTAHFDDYDIPIERVLVNSGDTPIEELRNLATEIAMSPDEQRRMIRNHYLGLIAAQQEIQS